MVNGDRHRLKKYCCPMRIEKLNDASTGQLEDKLICLRRGKKVLDTRVQSYRNLLHFSLSCVGPIRLLAICIPS